ncbi:hypothetical protein ACYULU_16020 [Breznakiellaceae bacterium SP9]
MIRIKRLAMAAVSVFTMFSALVGVPAFAQTNMALDTAIQNAARDVQAELPANAVAAIPYFKVQLQGTDTVKLSDYVLGELTGPIVNGKRLKMVEWRDLDVVRKSLKFDMSGEVSDDSAQGVGHFLGAQYLITGSFTDIGTVYKFRLEAVETKTVQKVWVYSVNVAKSDERVVSLLQKTSVPQWAPDLSRPGTYTSSDTGVYVGIVSFGSRAEDLTGGAPVLLDDEGLQRLNELLDTQYQKATQSGTALYYAVHRALSSLSANAPYFPDNLASVNVVTFTDGLDQGSTSLGLAPLEGQNFGGGSSDSYRAYLQTQIASRPVAGYPITAFSAGVQGSDVTDMDRFAGSLKALASKPENFYKLDNFSQLNEKFGKIADGLTVTSTIVTFTMVTPSFDPGTRIRMTFDAGENAGGRPEASQRYIEGTVALKADRSSYVLKDIVYAGGMGSLSGAEIEGSMNDQEVRYVFENFQGYHEGTDTVRQWTRSGSGWQINSEYKLGNSTRVETRKNSAVVYLVLDNSSSMSTADITAIRNAGNQFIQTLYDRSVPKSSLGLLLSHFYFGVRGGGSLRGYSVADDSNGIDDTGFSFEGALQAGFDIIPFGSWWLSVLSEVGFTHDTVRYQSGDGEEGSFASRSLLIPVLLDLRLTADDTFGLGFFVGPYFTIPLGSMEYSGGGVSNTYTFSVPVGLMFGFHLDWKVGPGVLFTNLSFGLDLGDTSISSGGAVLPVYSRMAGTLSVGYRIWPWRSL